MPPFRDPPALQLERVANFRDLGGHSSRDGRRVRRGQLFRSGHLAHTTESDLAALARLGLRSVFDFRTLHDIAADGTDRLPEGARHIRLSMPDPAPNDDIRALIHANEAAELEEVFGGGRAAELMVRGAAQIVRDRRTPYTEFLSHLDEPAAFPALFHCSAGKDRAGWAATVILLAVDVPEEQVVEQYLLSNRELEHIQARLVTQDLPAWQDLLRPLMEVRREYIASSFEAVREEWGSFDAYLHDGLGASEEQRERLREALLER